ncbi:hypothetical protein KTQ42_17305|uniref:hypothetical protein n=1 Tax=Noviherbaspirillum sp. L7-7A TaxID=2850560 RepID=UPI001C2B9CF4|nr:hypothetical protein [Noviherbaspirillum sp. L7-7A]MBV0881057.1 hypothetical protein [Noviherbaspirillum sp. L7-7A]
MNTVLGSDVGLTLPKQSRFYDFGVFIASFLWIYYLSNILSPRQFGISLDNFWFDADVPRYICQAVDRIANDHWRNKVHPLFSLMTYPLPNALKFFGIEIIQAIRIQLSLIVAIGAVFLFNALRNAKISEINAFLIVALGLSGAASLAWFSIPESYAYSFAAFSIVLFITTLRQKKSGIAMQWVMTIAIAFSVTVTNIAIAGWAAVQSCGIKRALILSAMAIAVVSVLAVTQRLLFPFSGIFFLPSAVQGEASFFVSISLERLRQVLALFFFGSLVFPEFQLVNMPGKEAFLTVQQAVWKRDSLLAVTALFLLSTFLLAGLVTIFTTMLCSIKKQGRMMGTLLAQSPIDRVSYTVVGSVVFLVLLHLVYGSETFVYSGSFLPFLLMILGLGVSRLDKYSKILGTGLLSILLATNAVHGLTQWHSAVAEVRIHAASAPNEKAMARNTCPFVKRQELF